MKKTRAFCLLAAANIFCFTATAQNKTFPGFFINLQSDTVRGNFPNFSQWDKSPAQVKFVTAANESLTLTTENCIYFSIEEQEDYAVYKGPRLINPIAEGTIMSDGDLTPKEEQYATVSAFVRLVASVPDYRVYLLSDKVRDNFFYASDGAPMQELKYFKYSRENIINEVAFFRNQLKTLFASNANQQRLTATLNKLPYSETALRRFFVDATGAVSSVSSAKRNNGGWIFSGGISYNSLSVSGADGLEITRHNYRSSVAPLFSAGYILPVGRKFGRYFFTMQVLASGFNIEGSSNSVTTSFRGTTLSPELYLGANLLNKENLKFFIQGGGGMMAIFGGRMNTQIIDLTTNKPENRESELSAATWIFKGHAGVLINNKIHITAGYLLPVPIGDYVYINPKLSAIQVSVGYTLSAK